MLPPHSQLWSDSPNQNDLLHARRFVHDRPTTIPLLLNQSQHTLGNILRLMHRSLAILKRLSPRILPLRPQRRRDNPDTRPQSAFVNTSRKPHPQGQKHLNACTHPGQIQTTLTPPPHPRCPYSSQTPRPHACSHSTDYQDRIRLARPHSRPDTRRPSCPPPSSAFIAILDNLIGWSTFIRIVCITPPLVLRVVPEVGPRGFEDPRAGT